MRKFGMLQVLQLLYKYLLHRYSVEHTKEFKLSVLTKIQKNAFFVV
jgi:hypothetical protein